MKEREYVKRKIMTLEELECSLRKRPSYKVIADLLNKNPETAMRFMKMFLAAEATTDSEESFSVVALGNQLLAKKMISQMKQHQSEEGNAEMGKQDDVPGEERQSSRMEEVEAILGLMGLFVR